MGRDIEEIGRILADYRKQHNYTLEQLSLKSGIGVSTLSDIERGIKFPRIATIRRLAAVYDIRFLVESNTATPPASMIEFVRSYDVDADLLGLLEDLGRRRTRPTRTVADWHELYSSLESILNE